MLGIMALRIAKLSSLLCLLVVVLAVLDGASGSDFCTQVVTPLGYGCTQFSVETDDGFVLAMHRLKRVQPVGDAHISGTAQPHVQNSGDNETERDQVSEGGDERAQYVGPNFVDLVPASESMVNSADHDGLRHASDSASSTLDRPKLGPHLRSCSCSCSCSDGNTTRTATCSEPGLAQNASRSSTPEQPFTRSSDANDPAPHPGAHPIHSNNSCSCSCSCSNDPASQEPQCSLSVPASRTPATATDGSKHTDHAQVHSHSTGSAATGGARNNGMLPDEPGRSSAAPDAPSVSRIQNASGSAGCSSPWNRTAHPRPGKGYPVLLMHMEFVNGDSWFKYVDADRHVSSLLPILLLEDGFDVWIGHQRATYWGHGHVKYKSTDREYWNWSWDEHAKYDLPVQLRFISTETNRSVHFIGASQAATVALAAATDHRMAQMFRSVTLIGPTAFCGNSDSTLLNLWAYIFGAFLDSRFYYTGFQNGAFNYSTEFPQTGPISGEGENGMRIGQISGPNCCLDSTSIEFTNGWDGTASFRNLLHWQQAIRTNNFAHYDYGISAVNIRAYGRPTPPAYNVANIPSQLPMLIVGGGKDWMAPAHGIRKLVSQMQRSPTIVNLTNYAHFDLFFSAKRKTDVYLPILQFLEGSDLE